MDVAYNQHSPYSRHHGRSSTNINHLNLVPLTSRLPLVDHDLLPDPNQPTSYIEDRSTPATPSILSRTSSRVSLRKPPKQTALGKSSSSVQLVGGGHQPRSSYSASPGGTKLRNGTTKDDANLSTLSGHQRNDSDWLVRAGAVMSSAARESKGQVWLVSRASSTSLTGQLNEDEVELERELTREREQASRRESRRGSAAGAFDGDDELSPVTTRRSLSFGPGTGPSRPTSRFGSRGNSRRGSRAQLFTPAGKDTEGYFDQRDFVQGDFVAEADFVDAEEEEYENDDGDANDDEAVVRKLARAGGLGLGSWVEKMLGWSLFAVDEDGEDEAEVEVLDEKAEDSEISSRPARRNLDGLSDTNSEERMPAPNQGEAGTWQDAAWLLNVATKVLL